jgi:hypothetical protein
LVVVIVAAVMCGIAYAMHRGAEPTKTGSQNATAWQPAAFAGPSSGGGWSPASLEPAPPLEPLPPPRRVRAIAMLTVWVVGIGAASAAVLGTAIFLGAHLVNRALGS